MESGNNFGTCVIHGFFFCFGEGTIFGGDNFLELAERGQFFAGGDNCVEISIYILIRHGVFRTGVIWQTLFICFVNNPCSRHSDKK